MGASTAQRILEGPTRTRARFSACLWVWRRLWKHSRPQARWERRSRSWANLTGATKVTFYGTKTKFTVESESKITTTVPSGATTGTVHVLTPGGPLSSNVPFRVTS